MIAESEWHLLLEECNDGGSFAGTHPPAFDTFSTYLPLQECNFAALRRSYLPTRTQHSAVRPPSYLPTPEKACSRRYIYTI